MEIQTIIEAMETLEESLAKYTEGQDSLRHLRKGLDIMNRPLRILVMGEFSTGKSTFIDAFLGKELLIRDTLPTTAVVTKIIYGKEHAVIVHYKDGRKDVLHNGDDIRKITAEDTSGNVKHSIRNTIDYVEITEPIELLKFVEFIDSPGLGADNTTHAQVTEAHKNDADIIFWVLNIQHAGRNTELQALQAFPERLKPFIILNQIDIVDEEEQIDAVVEQLRRTLKQHIQGIFPISSQDALDGKLNNDAELIEDSRIGALETYVSDVLLKKGDTFKINSILGEIIDFIGGIGLSLKQKERQAQSLRNVQYEKYIQEQTFISTIKQKIFSPLRSIIKEAETQENIENNAIRELKGLATYFLIDEEKGIHLLEMLAKKDEKVLQVLWQYYADMKESSIAVTWAKQLVPYKHQEAITFLANAYGDTDDKIYDIEQAVHWSKMAADMGVGSCQLAYGFYCYTGKGVEKNYDTAFSYLQKAALSHTSGAAFWLGQCYELGRGVPKNDSDAVEWYSTAVKEKDVRGIKHLALCYKNGKGTPKSYSKAITLFSQIINEDTSVSFDLGECCFLYGNELCQNEKTEDALPYLKQAVEYHYPKAEKALGDAYAVLAQKAKGDMEIEYYKTAVELGRSDLKGTLGLLYAKRFSQRIGNTSSSPDFQHAVALCKEAAASGNADAAQWLALQYERGNGVPNDKKQARKYYLDAAKGGNSLALVWVAKQFYYGTNGFPQDYEKAGYSFRESGYISDKKAYIDCANYIGNKFYYGTGTAVNHQKGFEWYKIAADLGDASAQNQVGYCYDCGIGVQKDANLAFRYFGQSARQNNKIAQANLGLCYQYGTGTAVDKKEAIKWYEKAADNGYNKAFYYLGEFCLNEPDYIEYISKFNTPPKNILIKYIKYINENYLKAYLQIYLKGEKPAVHEIKAMQLWEIGVKNNVPEAKIALADYLVANRREIRWGVAFLLMAIIAIAIGGMSIVIPVESKNSDFWLVCGLYLEALVVLFPLLSCDKQDVENTLVRAQKLYESIENITPALEKKINHVKEIIKEHKSGVEIFLSSCIIFFIIFFGGMGIITSQHKNATRSEQKNSMKIEEKDSFNPLQHINSTDDSMRRLNSNMSAFSINGISLEDSWRSVKDKLGTPLSSSDEDIYTRYKYPDLEIVVDRNNIVQAVVSLTSRGATKGVAVGDSLRDVVRQYGKDYAQSDYDDLTLYEYSFDTPTGKPALFRFAVNKSDQKVSYMSVRTLSDDVVKARNVFLDYHKAISNHNFNAAYSDLSQEMQANSGDVSAFSKGFETTLSSNVSRLHVVSVYPTSITFAYELEAEDRGPGLSRQTQRFNGTVTMIVENGQWKIGDMEAKKK